jgi:hypothetical protein
VSVADLPKAELHVHLEGTARPALIRRIARRNGLPLPDGLFADEDTFAWRDFLDFLNTYDMAASVIRTGEDYRDITYEYLAACAAEGAVYVELIASLDHGAAVGLPDDEHFAAIAQGIDDARADHGIEGGSSPPACATSASRRPNRSRGGRSSCAIPTSSASTWAATRRASRPGRSRAPTRWWPKQGSVAASTPASTPARSPCATRWRCPA